MGKSESKVTAEVLEQLSQVSNLRIFRNTVGAVRMPNGRYLRYGLCPGSYDFIGIQSIEITAEMVGSRIGQFVALEIKREDGGRLSDEQRAFGNLIKKFSGKALEVNRGSEVLGLLGT